MDNDKIREIIKSECDHIKELLLDKNASYGNSAFEPVCIFAHGDPAELIGVRIDDKLSRIKSGINRHDEDTTLDLIGYLVLLRVWSAIK